VPGWLRLPMGERGGHCSAAEKWLWRLLICSGKALLSKRGYVRSYFRCFTFLLNFTLA